MMGLRTLATAAALTATLSAPTHAQATIRFVDVGPGLCVIASFPGDQHLLYDAGHWFSRQCRAAADELVTDKFIELVVISHSDADHLGELDDILSDHEAGTILITGEERPLRSRRTGNPTTYADAQSAIARETLTGASVLNLATTDIAPGHQFQLGDATVTFVNGWHEWDNVLSTPGRLPSKSERRNAISIVVRIDYGGRSILLTGDSVGRRLSDPDPNACRDSQRAMVASAVSVPVRADYMLSAHHGGDNGDASCLIAAVNPRYVIVSAGHDHEHPRASTVGRYLDHGIPAERIFRTDRGDDEGHEEWNESRIARCIDGRGDDTIEIHLPATAGAETPTPIYLNATNDCTTFAAP
jgi:beta-lactamase superfamily II metal-dependent hydrolase